MFWNKRKKDIIPKEFKNFWKSYSGDKKGVLGLAMLLILIFLCMCAPYLPIHNPYELSNIIMNPPSWEHPFGTDYFGRDILSRTIWGIRVSMMFGFGVGIISLILGIVMGALPGYYGGLTDTLLSRTLDIFILIPRLFLIILMVALFGNDIYISMFVVAITTWPSNARITRAQTLTLKNRVFVKAAKVSGTSDLRILLFHILPNGLSPVIVNSTLQMGGAVITEAGLSFLGLGDLNVVSLGQILMQAQKQLVTWWMAFFPGLVLCLIVLSFNFVGGGVNYALNPRLRER